MMIQYLIMRDDSDCDGDYVIYNNNVDPQQTILYNTRHI